MKSKEALRHPPFNTLCLTVSRALSTAFVLFFYFLPIRIFISLLLSSLPFFFFFVISWKQLANNYRLLCWLQFLYSFSLSWLFLSAPVVDQELADCSSWLATWTGAAGPSWLLKKNQMRSLCWIRVSCWWKEMNCRRANEPTSPRTYNCTSCATKDFSMFHDWLYSLDTVWASIRHVIGQRQWRQQRQLPTRERERKGGDWLYRCPSRRHYCRRGGYITSRWHP